MPAFRFEALDAQGRRHKGVMEAESARSVRNALRTQNRVPVLVEAVQGGKPSATGLQRELWVRPVLGSAERAVWTRQLAGLVSAGLPLEKALSALIDDDDANRISPMVAALRCEVNAGNSFAKALQAWPREFPPVYCAVVAAGEQSGQLGIVLDQLAQDQEQQENLKNKVLAAALYPMIVSVIAVMIILFLMSYVVPKVAQVFEHSKASLPLITVMMLATSRFVLNYGWLLLLLFGGGLCALRMALRREGVRLAWDGWLLKAPVVGKLSRNYHGARFASTLALLTAAGVPILKALQTAGDTLGNAALRADAAEALTLVREGAPLWSALAHRKRLPRLLLLFARLGEQTGALPTMLERAAKQLAEHVQRRATALATVMEPVLILAMGIVVMAIVMAVLLPIIQMNQMV